MYSTPSELACLEDFLTNLLQQQHCPIGKDVFKYLWATYVKQPPSDDPAKYEEKRAENRAALQLLTYCSKVHNSILEEKKRALMEHTLKAAQNPDIDWLLFREEMNAFQKIVKAVEPVDVEFLNKAINTLIEFRHCPRTMDWFCAAEEVINTIFALLDYPERHSEYIIHELSRNFINVGTEHRPESDHSSTCTLFIFNSD